MALNGPPLGGSQPRGRVSDPASRFERLTSESPRLCRGIVTLRPPVTPEGHIQGPEDAAVTLVEYGDYECPHCGRAYSIIKRVQKHFGKRLRFVFRNFPLSELHPHAESAAETAEFAGAHGKFWEMHDLLFENQERLSELLYLGLAKELGLAPEALRQALEQAPDAETMLRIIREQGRK